MWTTFFKDIKMMVFLIIGEILQLQYSSIPCVSWHV